MQVHTMASQSFKGELQAIVRKRHQRSETNSITFGYVGTTTGCCCLGDSIAEQTAHAFDFEVSPARFRGNLCDKIRSEGGGVTVAVVGKKRQQVDAGPSVLAGVQPHDVGRDKQR